MTPAQTTLARFEPRRHGIGTRPAASYAAAVTGKSGTMNDASAGHSGTTASLSRVNHHVALRTNGTTP